MILELGNFEGSMSGSDSHLTVLSPSFHVQDQSTSEPRPCTAMILELISCFVIRSDDIKSYSISVSTSGLLAGSG